MSMRQRLGVIWLCTIVPIIAVGTKAWGEAVFFTTVDLGGGLFQYSLTVDNAGGMEPISGLLVLHGNSAFGLDATSLIAAPQDVAGNPAADWDFFAPDSGPPLVDELDYFSLDPAGDVPIDGALGGFGFRSTKDPATLSGGDFRVDLIGSLTASQIPLVGQPVPEPPALLLLGPAVVGLVGFGILGRRRSRHKRLM
jgi:hypothetical protein